HTDVGNKCVGAKVNGRMVPLDYKLKTGDIVEIITSANSKGPSRDWLSIAKSSQAKNKIRQWFKRTFKEENIEKGREAFEKEIKRQGLNLNEALKAEYIEPVIRKFNFSNIEDLYSAIGSGALTVHQVISKLKEEIKKEDILPQKEIITEDKTEKKPRKGEIKKPGVIIEGERDLFVRFAKCCNPVPGDEIIGFITRGRG
ncbi:MAG: DUF5913 domain-containing protein, partial [Caloramator sp.]|nr:DUF5913 domain-containing protein [Caloramator sp.]